MTVMPEHAARLPETSRLLVLDPISGPSPRSVANLALGDEILVQAEGRMCFRRLLSLSEAAAPPLVSRLQPNALAPDSPRAPISLDSRQPVGAPVADAAFQNLTDFAPALAPPEGEYWMDVLIEGATRIIVDNLSVRTGPLASTDSTRSSNTTLSAAKAPKPAKAPQAAVAPPPVTADPAISSQHEIGAPLKAFTGQVELPLLAPVPAEARMVLQFILPPRTTTLRLISPSAHPPGETRKLGVAIFGLSVETTAISLDSPALVRGFHRSETGEGLTWRWTDGEALLIMQPKPLPQLLSVHITDWHKFLPVD